MQKVELNLSELRAEIEIWEDSAKDALTKYQNESNKIKKDQHWAGYEEFTAIVTLLSDMQMEPNVMVDQGVTNQEISDTMYNLFEEIEDDMDFLFDTDNEDEEETLKDDYIEVFQQLEYLVDLVTDEFEDAIIVITPQEIESEIQKLNIKLDQLSNKITTAANSASKNASQDEYLKMMAHVDLLTYIAKDIADSDEPDRGVSRMEVGERMWEVMEEFGISVNLMLSSETDGDRGIYYDQAISTLNKVKFLMGLEAYMQSQNYNKDATPGEEDEIMELIEELYDERVD